MKKKQSFVYKELLKKLPTDRFTNCIDVPIYRAVNYFFENTEQVYDYHRKTPKRARYGRYDNLTWEHTEMLLAYLEDCEESVLFPSGMNAIVTSIFAICDAGSHIIYNNNCYRNISRFCQDILPRFGIQASGISSLSPNFINDIDKAIKSNTKAILIEIPSNPHNQLVDITKLKQVLKGTSDIVLIVDSTFASPYNFKPSQYGADLVIQSCTKYLAGNANLMAGSVSGSTKLTGKIRNLRNVLGGVISPEDSYLLAHGIYTLKPRMEYYNKVGLKLAQFLEKHPKINKVYYTRLESNPQFSLAKKLLKGGGGVVSFELDASPHAVSKFIEGLRIPFMATHFGGPFTTIEQYGIFTLYHMDKSEKKKIGINDQLIRMCLGFEDIDMILDDLEQGLTKI